MTKGKSPLSTKVRARHTPHATSGSLSCLSEVSTDKPELTRRTSVTSEEDLNAARDIRKRALKDGQCRLRDPDVS